MFFNSPHPRPSGGGVFCPFLTGLASLLLHHQNMMMQIKRIPLWELTRWSTCFNSVDPSKQDPIRCFKRVPTFNRLRKMATEGGDIRLFNSGRYDAATTAEVAGDFLCEGEVILFPEGGSASGIKYHNGRFCYATSYVCVPRDPDVILTKFLYYWMEEHAPEIDRRFHGATIRQPDMTAIFDIEMDVPPIDYQRMACRQLDALKMQMADIRQIKNTITSQANSLRNGIISSLVPERAK